MPDTTRVYAVCQLGDLRFAVNADDVVQAIPRPTGVLQLPQHQAPDTPVFMLRGQVLPMLDMLRWLPATTRLSETPPDKVMVLRCDNRWAAIAIDELVGMQRSVGRQVVPLHHDTKAQANLFHSVLLPEPPHASALPLPLLDTAALLQLSGTWGPTAAEAQPAAETSHTALAPKNTVMASDPDATDPALPVAELATAGVYAWLRLSGQNALIESRWLASVEPMPPLQRVTGHHPDNLGVATWRGRDLQVVQLTALLGPRASGAPALLAVLTDGERHMGVAVDEARHIENLDLAALQKPEAGGLPSHPALHGVVYHPNGQRCLVLNAQGLLDSTTHFGQTKSRLGADTLVATGSAADPQGLPAHIVFQGGSHWALGINHIEALTENPAVLDPAAHNAHPALLGGFLWRTRSVPLWDLKHLTSGQATTPGPQARVVLVRHAGGLLGLLTEQLLMLLPARQGTLSTVKRDGGALLTLITVQQGPKAQSFRVLSLQEHLPTQVF